MRKLVNGLLTMPSGHVVLLLKKNRNRGRTPALHSNSRRGRPSRSTIARLAG